MEEPASFAFHTEASEPVTAYGLPVATASGKVGGGGVSGGGGGWGSVVVGNSGSGSIVGLDYGYGCGGLGGTRVESSFEVEA